MAAWATRVDVHMRSFESELLWTIATRVFYFMFVCLHSIPKFLQDSKAQVLIKKKKLGVVKSMIKSLDVIGCATQLAFPISVLFCDIPYSVEHGTLLLLWHSKTILKLQEYLYDNVAVVKMRISFCACNTASWGLWMFPCHREDFQLWYQECLYSWDF